MPVALTSKVTASPSAADALFGCAVITGLTITVSVAAPEYTSPVLFPTLQRNCQPLRSAVAGTVSVAVSAPLMSSAFTLAQLPLLLARHCHCQLRPLPVAVTLKVVVSPAVAVTLFGSDVIVGFSGVTVSVAAPEYVVPALFLTLQRYW